MVRKAQPVRAVILPRAIGALGNDDEHHVDPRLGGLTVAWIPGDHGITMMLGGFTQDGAQHEPALTAFITAQSVQRIIRRGFPNELSLLATMLRTIDEPAYDRHGEVVTDYEWWEEYNPNANDELGGLGYFSGSVHCIVLAKSDPLRPTKPPGAYHTGFRKESGKRSRTQDFQYSKSDGLIITLELGEGTPSELGGDSWRPDAERKFLLRFDVPERVAVFLTAEEVEDLLIVLRYQPDWWYEPTELKG
jgi:hypothetical protein